MGDRTRVAVLKSKAVAAVIPSSKTSWEARGDKERRSAKFKERERGAKGN